MKIPAKIYKMHVKTYEQGSSKIFAENREDLDQNFWNTEKEKDREKEKVGGRPAKLNEKKGHRELERERKNKGDIFFLVEERHENFVAAVRKWEMLAATEAKMSASEKENKQTNNEQEHTRKFLEVSCRSRAKQRHRNVQKVCCTCRVAFSLIRPIVVFFTFLVAFAA